MKNLKHIEWYAKRARKSTDNLMFSFGLGGTLSIILFAVGEAFNEDFFRIMGVVSIGLSVVILGLAWEIAMMPYKKFRSLSWSDKVLPESRKNIVEDDLEGSK